MGNAVSRLMSYVWRHQTSDDTIVTNIGELRNDLMNIIEIGCGLNHTLRSMKILNQQQIEMIESKPTPSSQISQLIEDVIAMSPQHQDQFLAALNKSQQSHVVDYIHANGIRTQEHGDSWPLRFTKSADNIITCWVKLIEMLDSKNGLLDEMLSVGCINNQHKQVIETGKTDAHVNESVILVLLRRSVTDYNKFIECLMKIKNYSVVLLLEPDLVRNLRFPSADRINKLQMKHALLVAIIDTKHGLLAELLAADCITWRQKQSIEEAETQVKRNTTLLDIVKRGIDSDFDFFLDCLDRTGQKHVRSLLLEDGVVAHMIAEISGAQTANGDEGRIVEQFMRLLDSGSDVSVKYWYEKVQQKVYDRLGPDVRLAALNTGSSIILFYVCTSLAGVYYLHELYSSTELATHIEELFTLLLNNGRPVKLDSLHWDLTDYTNGIRNLCVSSNLPSLFKDIYQMTTESHDNIISTRERVFGLELLPSEMVEMLLIKATGQLFVTINKMESRAEALTLATLSAVSCIWWRTLTYRQFNKRLLKRYFRQVCRPYKCNPRQLSKSIKSDGNVWGVAEFNNKVYATYVSSDTIQVFSNRPPFTRLEDIKVEGLNNPHDIVVCSETSQLYIADSQCAIWRMNLLFNKQVDKFITTDQWQPLNLSIKSGRLLITPYDGDALFIYGDDGVQLNRIPIPEYMWARHSVESSHNTYIVSHRKRFIEDTQSEHKDGVSEFDVDGRIIRQLNNQQGVSLQFNKTSYLLIDASNYVIVADRLNERIVLLKPDLQLKRVLIPKLQGLPFRMCFNEETGLLFVGCLRSTDVRIFSVMQRHNL